MSGELTTTRVEEGSTISEEPDDYPVEIDILTSATLENLMVENERLMLESLASLKTIRNLQKRVGVLEQRLRAYEHG